MSAHRGGFTSLSGMGDPVEQEAALLQRRNAFDADLAAIMNRPMTSLRVAARVIARSDVVLDLRGPDLRNRDLNAAFRSADS
jgi:hypothetical protein